MKKVRFLIWALCVLMLLTIVPIATNAAPGADGSVTITATAPSLIVGETADVKMYKIVGSQIEDVVYKITEKTMIWYMRLWKRQGMWNFAGTVW